MLLPLNTRQFNHSVSPWGGGGLSGSSKPDLMDDRDGKTIGVLTIREFESKRTDTFSWYLVRYLFSPPQSWSILVVIFWCRLSVILRFTPVVAMRSASPAP